jgi:hypothetical protein
MNELLSELKEIVVEFGFSKRWAEIEMFWLIGQLLNQPGVKTNDLPEIADFLGVDEDDIWDAIIFYKKYPDLDVFPSGKNISWKAIKEQL